MAVTAMAIGAPTSAHAPGVHWCRQGDPPLYASARTGCSLAGRVITDYVNICQESRNCQMRVSSWDSRRPYRVACHRRGSRHSGIVYCHAPAGTGIWVRFWATI